MEVAIAKQLEIFTFNERYRLNSFNASRPTKFSCKSTSVLRIRHKPIRLGPIMSGDPVNKINMIRKALIAGPGIRRAKEANHHLKSTQSGSLMHRFPNLYWVESKRKRYIPRRSDLVIGVVTKKSGDVFKVDIGCAEQASLSVYAFEGATKKQKPNLDVGDVVFAKVLSARREMEPDLVCIDQYYRSKNMGHLDQGHLLNLPINFVQLLLSRDCELLDTLGRKFEFEVAVGVNGRIWLSAKTAKDVLKISRIIKAAMKLSIKPINHVCKRFR